MDESERRRLSNSKLTRGPFLDAIPFNHPPRPARANSRLRFETGRSSDWTRESVPLSRPPDRLRRANAKNAFYPTANDDDPWDEIYRPRDTDGIITSSFSLSLSLSLSLARVPSPPSLFCCSPVQRSPTTVSVSVYCASRERWSRTFPLTFSAANCFTALHFLPFNPSAVADRCGLNVEFKRCGFKRRWCISNVFTLDGYWNFSAVCGFKLEWSVVFVYYTCSGWIEVILQLVRLHESFAAIL